MPRFATLLLGIFLLAYMALILWKAFREPDNNFERWKNITQILAVLAAGVFFTTQFLSGWTSTNMHVGLKTERVAVTGGPQEADTLAVRVDLEKGEYGSIKLHDVAVRAVDPDTGVVIAGPKTLVGIERVETDTNGRVDWNRRAEKEYRIASNENLHFGGVLRVPRGRACVVEAAVIGYPDLWLPRRGYSQWRASVVSLPADRPQEKPADETGKPGSRE
jgi:hypothetical protein